MDRVQAERFDKAVKQMAEHAPAEHLHSILHRIVNETINTKPTGSGLQFSPISMLCMELGKEIMVDASNVHLDDAALLCALAARIGRQYVARPLDANGNVVGAGNVYVYEGEHVSVAGYADGGMVCIETVDGCFRWTAANELRGVEGQA